MVQSRSLLQSLLAALGGVALLGLTGACAKPGQRGARMEKRWLFVWRDMSNPQEVDRLIERFPRAQAAGYNGVVCSPDIPPEKAPALRAAAEQHGLDLVAIAMGGARDRNCMEGVLCKDALFVAHGGTATLVSDNPTQVVNGDFEDVTGNHFNGWQFQDDEGVTTFADHEIAHGGRTSLRMESVGKNEHRHCRIMQPIKLQPYRHYRASFWLKSENLSHADPEVKVLTDRKSVV